MAAQEALRWQACAVAPGPANVPAVLWLSSFRRSDAARTSVGGTHQEPERLVGHGQEVERGQGEDQDPLQTFSEGRRRVCLRGWNPPTQL